MLKPNIANRTPFSPKFSVNPHLFPVGTNMYVVYPPISEYYSYFLDWHLLALCVGIKL